MSQRDPIQADAKTAIGWQVTFATDAGEFSAHFLNRVYTDPYWAAAVYAHAPSTAGRPLLWLKIEPMYE